MTESKSGFREVARSFRRRNTSKIIYKGTLSGEQLKMTRQREGGSGQVREFTLKRAGE